MDIYPRYPKRIALNAIAAAFPIPVDKTRLRGCLMIGGEAAALIDLKFAFTGTARLHLVPHANCRLADLPVRKILNGQHLCADLTLPYGRVLHDYLA